MRILVAFKVTPDYEALHDQDWREGPVDGAAPPVESRFVRRVLNCFDESALELSLRLAASVAERDRPASTPWDAAILTALTVGDRTADPYLGTLLALGFSTAARVQTGPGDLDFAPAVTAAIVAAYARTIAPDLLLLGCRSGPGDGGTIPFRLAEELGWPCLSQVTVVQPLPDGRLRATSERDDGMLTVTLRPPCIVAVGNAVVSHLRVPTLSARLAARARRVDLLTPRDLGVDAPGRARAAGPVLTRLERVRRERPGLVVEGADAGEKARRLYDLCLRERLTGGAP